MLSIAIYCYLLLSIGYLSDIYWISIRYLSDIYQISIGYFSGICWISARYLWGKHTCLKVLYSTHCFLWRTFWLPWLCKTHVTAQAMSAQSIPETQDDTLFPCVKCGMDCSAASGAVLRGAAWQCKWCTNVYQILYRHLGGLPDSWSTMSPQSQQEFFKHAGSSIKCAPKNGRWSHVRSALVTQVCHFHTEQRRVRLSREYLPLTVWETRGFDVKRIQQYGEMRQDEALQILVCSTLGRICLLLVDISSKAFFRTSKKQLFSGFR